MTETHSHAGACFCGEVRYRLRRDPMFVHACHCRDCRKQTGGPYAINALIERSEVELVSGVPVRHEQATGSGKPHDIWRCGSCGNAVWSDYGRREVMVFIRVATLDEPERCPPDVHIFTRSALPFTPIPEPARQFPVFYDMQAEWPQAALDRFDRLGTRRLGAAR
ncbi:GFA family protein [Maricaulis sp.]|uniref:GFA family protein n=1 Tax=Maricaulis sp. TaxID=1486257 RepID=UPI002B2737CD|nr:GFA family protein [Maricaulis sp.]